MNTYQIMSEKWAVGVMVKDCIKPELVEKLAQQHYTEVLMDKGKFNLMHEKFISFFNAQLGKESATYAQKIDTCSHVIVL